jgi:hypothetical protein
VVWGSTTAKIKINQKGRGNGLRIISEHGRQGSYFVIGIRRVADPTQSLYLNTTDCGRFIKFGQVIAMTKGFCSLQFSEGCNSFCQVITTFKNKADYRKVWRLGKVQNKRQTKR